MFTRIDTSGTPFERGRQHGTLARAKVLGSARVYAAIFASVGIDWPTACAQAWRYREVVADLAPALYAEMQGIAAGSGLSLDGVLALNARTEILPPVFPGGAVGDVEAARARNAALGWADLSECTSLAVSGDRMEDGRTRVAQNWDWVGAQRAHVILLTIRRDDGPDVLLVTEAGMLGKIGVNAHGLAIGLNILRAKNDGARIGLPVHVFQRAALDCASVTEVLAFAGRLPFAASSNAILGDAGGAVASLEYNPAGIGVLAPEQGVVLHTNHFCTRTLAPEQAPLDAMLTTEPRLGRAQAIARAWPERVPPRAIEALLSDATGGVGAIAREPDPALAAHARIETVLGVVIDCVERSLSIAPGVPARTPFAPPIRLGVATS
jgi:isopenicillin-N N-acyltransferase-like protein